MNRAKNPPTLNGCNSEPLYANRIPLLIRRQHENIRKQSRNCFWNKTCRYRACLLSASPLWRSGRSQGGVERGKGRTTLTANASRYIRARGTPVPRRDSAISARNSHSSQQGAHPGNEDWNRFFRFLILRFVP